MSEYNESASLMREKLNNISPTFCAAKWLQVSLHLPQGRTQSCYHPPTHVIPIELLKKNPSVLHNTPQKIEERKMMIAGKRPAGCSYCWKMEDAPGGGENGHLSDRHYRSSEWWSAPLVDTIAENGAEWDVAPTYVEVNFNQACNFKCMYCSPHLSTTWEEEIKKHGEYKLGKGYRHNDISALDQIGLMPLHVSNKENPYVTAFWEWWPLIYPGLRVFRMTGGEPLMDANTYKILDYVNDNPHGALELAVTSNFCPPTQNLFDKFIESVKKLEKVRMFYDDTNFNEISQNNWYIQSAFKHFMVFVSCDGYGKQAEYMRNGMNFDVLVGNVNTFLKETRCTSISFINTFNVLSIPSLKDFLQMILNLRKIHAFAGDYTLYPEPDMNGTIHGPFVHKNFQRILFDIPLLRYPNWFMVQNSGQAGISKVKEAIKFMEDNNETNDEVFTGFKEYEILKLKRNLAVMEEGISINELRQNKGNFYRFIEQHDERRNTNFLQTFPELKLFYIECKNEAKNETSR